MIGENSRMYLFLSFPLQRKPNNHQGGKTEEICIYEFVDEWKNTKR